MQRNNTNIELFITMATACLYYHSTRHGSIPDRPFYNMYYIHTLSVVWLTGITGWTGFDSPDKIKESANYSQMVCDYFSVCYHQIIHYIIS